MKKLLYFLLGIGIAIAATAYAVNVTVPQSNVQGSLPIGNSNGTYTNGNITVGSGLSVDTSTVGTIKLTNTAAGGGATTTITAGVKINGPDFTFASGSPDTTWNILASGSTVTFNHPNNLVQNTLTVSAGTGLTGGGDLSTNRTISLSVPVTAGNGGTGTTTAPTQLGQILAVDGSNAKYAPTTLIQGNDITITTSTPGSITIAFTNSSNYITLGSLSANSPLSYNSGTGAFSCSSCLTGNQNITLSGDITGSGATAITTTYNNVVPVNKGGTNTSTTASINGQFLGWTNASYGPWNFIQGTNITISTSTTGQVQISAPNALTAVSADSPLGGNGTSGSHLTCATCVTSVTGTTPINSSGGTTPAISVSTGDLQAATPLTFSTGDGKKVLLGTTTKLSISTGDLTLTSSNLSFGTGDGKQILLGTTTNITLTDNPTFTKFTMTNGSTTNFTISGNGYLTGLTGQNCIGTSASGLLQAGTCGGGSLSGGINGEAAYWTSTTAIGPSAALLTDGTVVGVNATTSNVALTVKGISGNNNALTVSSSSGLTLLQILPDGTASTTKLIVSNTQSAILLTSATGAVSGYAGASNCGDTTPVKSLSALGATTCVGSALQTALTNPDTGTGVAGQVSVWSGTTALTGDAAFLWSTTNHTLSINSSTPQATLVVQGSSTAPTLDIFRVATSSNATFFNVTSTGKVGIGSTTPTAQLVLQNAQGTNDVFRIASSSAAVMDIFDYSGHLEIGTTTATSQIAIQGSSTLNVDALDIYNASGQLIESHASSTDPILSVGSSTPVANFTVVASSTSATTTVQFGDPSASKGACIKLMRGDGTPVYLWVNGGSTTLNISASANACSSVTGF